MVVDPIKLQGDLIEFADRGSLPFDLAAATRTLITTLAEHGVRQPPPPPPPPHNPTPAVVDVEANAHHVRLAVEQTDAGERVVSKDPQGAPVARTLQKVLDMMARRPIGSMAAQALEVTLHVEMLEMENADLRRALEEANVR